MLQYKVLRGGTVAAECNATVQRVSPLLSGFKAETYGSHLIATFDHTPENCGHLYRNGEYVKGPAFDWALYGGRFAPRPEQRLTVDLMTQNNRFYCFNGLATGKTASSLWAAEFLRHAGKVRRVLIVTTIACMDAVWARELDNLCPHRSKQVIRGGCPTRAKRLAEGCDYDIINHHGVKSTLSDLLDVGYDLIIGDEASIWRNASTDLTKAMIQLSLGKRLWALTATPRPRSSMDAWGLGKLVNPTNLPKSKRQFQDMTMIKVTDFIWQERKEAIDIVYSVLTPAVRIRTEDCVSLPSAIYVNRDVPMSKEQEAVRKRLIKEYVYTLKNDPNMTITPANAADLRNKVLQVAQGALLTGQDQIDTFDMSASMAEAVNFIEQAEGKAIVLATYRATVTDLVARLTKEFGAGSVAVAQGQQSAAARSEEINKFVNDPKCRILVANPHTIGHGLNLICATLVLWFGVTANAEIYEQANARPQRPGQTKTTVIAHILRCAEEREALAVCQRRVSDQKTLLDMVAKYTAGRY